MEGIKAKIRGDGVDSSVEFSVEEAIAHTPGRHWGDMSAAEREEALKDYALMLFSRDTGRAGELQVTLSEGSFSTEDIAPGGEAADEDARNRQQRGTLSATGDQGSIDGDAAVRGYADSAKHGFGNVAEAKAGTSGGSKPEAGHRGS